MLCSSTNCLSQSPVKWEEVKKEGAGKITVYWYESNPFIYQTKEGEMQGIEFEIFNCLKKYSKNKYNVTLQINWVEADGFTDTFDRISSKRIDGTFGTSAFSITDERRAHVNFSPSYLADISVMISSKNVPVVETEEDFKSVFSTLTAITIKGTTNEEDLLKLKSKYQLPFEIKLIPSSKNILNEIEKADNSFGFIDLPVYMILFNKNPSIQVERQNLFPVKREGHGIIFPIGSSWKPLMEEYFLSDQYKADFKGFLPKYLDAEVYQFVENLSILSNDPLTLLNKEKEIQYRHLMEKTSLIESEAKVRNILIALVVISIAMLTVIIFLYQKKNAQKEKIETQRKSIEMKSLQLEKRNEHLVAINEEKNNLIKILAHDLRTPINHVQGLSQLLTIGTNSLSDDQKEIIQKITDASVRLNKMITNILDIDGLENNRVKAFIERVNMGLLLNQVVKSFQKQAAKKGIHLSFAQPKETLIIHGDPLFLTQVFENLISNALKFSPREKSIEVFFEPSDHKVRVIVQDHGQGLTTEDMQLVFKKFSKLSAHPTAGEGSTGLGLSIVKKYVEMMNGLVWCESQPGIVTKFFVEFDMLEG